MGQNVVGTGVYELRTDDSRFTQGLEKADKQAQQTGSKLETIGKAAAVGFGAAGVAAAGFTTLSVKSFLDFENQMNQVLTIVPNASKQTFDEMTGQVKDFAKEFGVLPNEVLPGLYDALGAGVPADNVFSFLETAQKAAVGGATDLGTAVDGLTTVVNAFGADTISAERASDILFESINLGKGTMEEMARSMSNVTPVAAALGVDFADVGAALAALTAQGVPTSVATNQVRNVLAELGKEGTKVSDIFKEQTGKSFQDFIAEGGNMQTALQALEEHAGEAGISMIDMFGSIEAGQAALALTGKGTDAFTEAMDAMQNSAGATDRAYQQMDQGMSRSLDRIRAQFEVLKLEVGSRVAPAFATLLEFITGRVIPGISSLASVLSGPVGHAFNLIRDGVLTLAAALQGDWTNAEGIHPLHSVLGQVGNVVRNIVVPAFDVFTNTILPALGSVVGFVTDNWKTFSTILGGPVFQVVLKLFQAIGEDGLLGGLRQLPSIIGEVASNFANVARTLGSGLIDTIGSVDWGGLASTIGDGLGQAFGAVTGLGGQLIDGISNAFSNADWGGMAATFVDGLLAGVTAVADFGSRILGWIGEQFGAVDWTATAQTLVDGLVTGVLAVADFATRIATWIAEQFSAVDWTATGQALLNGITTGLTAAGEGATFVTDWLSGLFANSDFAPIAQSFATGFQQGFQGITPVDTGSIVQGLLGDLSGLATSITESIGPALSTLADILGPRIQPTLDTFRASIGEIAQNLLPQLKPILDSLIQSWNNLAPAIQPTAQVLGVVAGIMAGAFFVAVNTLVNVLGSMLPGAVQVATGALQTIAGVLQLVTNSVGSIVQIVVGLLTGDWAMAWEGAQQLVSGTVDAIGTIIGGLGNVVLGAISGLVDGVIGFFEGLYHSLVGGSIVPDMVNGIIDWFTQLPGQVLGIVSGFVSGVVGFFADLAAQAISSASSMVTSIIGFYADLAATAISTISGMVSSVLGFFADLVATVPGQMGGLVSSVTGFLIDMASNAATEAQNFVTNITSKLGELVSTAPAIISSAIGAIGTEMGNLAGQAFGWGADIVQGILDGLRSLIPDISGVAGEIGSAVGGGLEGVLGVFSSPPPLSIKWGEWIAQGIALGMEDQEARVAQAGRIVAEATAAGVESGLPQFTDAMLAIQQEVTAGTFGILNEVSGLGSEFTDEWARYVSMIITDGDYLNDWLTHFPEEWRDTAKAIGGAIASFVEDGETMSDWLTHLPDETRASLEGMLAGWEDLLGETEQVVSFGMGRINVAAERELDYFSQIWHQAFASVEDDPVAAMEAATNAVRSSFETIVGDLEGLASGDVLKNLETALADAISMKNLAVEAGLPAEVVAQYEASIAELQAQLEVAANLAGTETVQAIAEGMAAADLEQASAEQAARISDAVANVFSASTEALASGDVIRSALEEQQRLIDAIARAEAAGLTDLVTQLQSELGVASATVEAAMQAMMDPAVQAMRDAMNAEEIALAWDERLSAVMSGPDFMDGTQEAIQALKDKINLATALGADPETLAVWEDQLAEAEATATQQLKDFAVAVAQGLVSEDVLKEFGAAGNEEFLAMYEELAGPEATKKLVEGLSNSNADALAEVRKQFAAAPEMAGQFVDGLVQGVKDGMYTWDEVMQTLAVLPREQLIPLLEELEQKFGVEFVDALIAGNEAAQTFANEGLAAVDKALQDVKASTEDATSALDTWSTKSGSVAGGSGGGGGGGSNFNIADFATGAGGGGGGGNAISGDLSGTSLVKFEHQAKGATVTDSMGNVHPVEPTTGPISKPVYNVYDPAPVGTKRVDTSKPGWEDRVERYLKSGYKVITYHWEETDQGRNYVVDEVYVPSPGAIFMRRLHEQLALLRELNPDVLKQTDWLPVWAPGGGRRAGGGGGGGDFVNRGLGVEGSQVEANRRAMEANARNAANAFAGVEDGALSFGEALEEIIALISGKLVGLTDSWATEDVEETARFLRNIIEALQQQRDVVEELGSTGPGDLIAKLREFALRGGDVALILDRLPSDVSASASGGQGDTYQITVNAPSGDSRDIVEEIKFALREIGLEEIPT